jgi:hypothetical protein
LSKFLLGPEIREPSFQGTEVDAVAAVAARDRNYRAPLPACQALYQSFLPRVLETLALAGCRSALFSEAAGPFVGGRRILGDPLRTVNPFVRFSFDPLPGGSFLPVNLGLAAAHSLAGGGY